MICVGRVDLRYDGVVDPRYLGRFDKRLLAGTRVRARFLCQKRGYLFNFHREKNLGKLLIEFFISKFFGTLLTSTVPTKGSGQYSTHKRFLVLLTLYYRVLGYFSYTHEEL
jgi:hypothetical protein